MTTQNLRAVSLRRVLPSASFVGCADIAASAVADHHARCRPGHLFAVVHGTSTSGENYLPQAIQAGATAVLVDRPMPDVDLPQCVVPSVREAYSRLCLAFAGHPDRFLTSVGVTGTNGKTTVTWLLRSILQQAGYRVGLSGTVEYCTGDNARAASLTTPGPGEFSQLLREMVRGGTTHAVMELSSHALHQARLGGLTLSAALVTNITQDHFDYHGTPDAYLAAKARIADYCGPHVPLIVNSDDPVCRRLMEHWSDRKVIGYGLNPGSEARGAILEMQQGRTTVCFELLGARFDFEIRLPGRHSVSNCLGAAAVAMSLGVSPQDIATGLAGVDYVPGRLQPIDLGQGPRVFVDYAHTPDALTHAIAAVRCTTAGRVFCVFGAGGDRDSSKRPLMGQAASAADVAVVTSDNPRSEDPLAIIANILSGIETAKTHVEPDRRAAIQWAIREAEPGDCVLIAGKGHERTQQIGSECLPFDDREVAATYIASQEYRLASARREPSERSWTR